MLEIRDINLEYGDNVILNKINYKFEENVIYALIGRNGVGKTSLLKSISGLNHSYEGDVLFRNNSIKNQDYLKRDLIYISDSPVYYSDLTVLEHLLMVCKFQKYSKEVALTKTNDLLEKLKLEPYRHYLPATLSKGTLQRLNIAMSVIRDACIYLFDEPFTALDPLQVSIVEDLILELKEQKKLIIVSSHDIDSLNSISDKYLTLNNGSLVELKDKAIQKGEIIKLISESYGAKDDDLSN